jgi:hypothetical protein
VYSDRWSPGLRQGDIVGKIQLPLLGKKFEVSVDTQSLVAPVSGAALPRRAFVPIEETFVVVVSHDCEFNEGKRNKLLVARLQRPPGNLDSDQLDALRASNDFEARIRADQPVAGVDNWVFRSLPGVLEVEHVVSFTTITPLPMTMRDDLRSVKRAELLHEERVRFREKLAYFMGRKADDVPDADKVPAPAPSDARSGVHG